MQKNKILVTGGAGFIGRAVVARCLREGHEVAVLDNLCAGQLDNLKAFIDDIHFYEVDILDAELVREIMAREKPSVIYHLAAHHFIPFCNEHPNETLRVNVEGTHVVLSEAARQGVRKAVVASSGAFYPSVDEILNEKLEAAPVDVYGLSKLMTEQVAGFIARTSDMSCVSARLFNTYGPFETNPHLIPDIITHLRKGSVIELGNIHTKRDYIFVDDVAELLYQCMIQKTGNYIAVNVGTGDEYSAREIVESISELLGYGIEIVIDPARVRPVDKLHQRADTRLLHRLTGITARHGLAEGLQKLLRHEGFLEQVAADAHP